LYTADNLIHQPDNPAPTHTGEFISEQQELLRGISPSLDKKYPRGAGALTAQ